MRTSVAIGIVAAAVVIAIGIGFAAANVFRPAPSPTRVGVTFTPGPSASRVPVDEATLFRQQPLSAGCATPQSVWIVTNGGGLLRYDGAQWSLVDPTLRSLVSVSCSSDAAYAVGLVGALVISDEVTRQITSRDITTENLYGVSAFRDGALMVGSHGAVFVLIAGDVPQPYAKGIDEDLFDVVQFGLQSAWAVGEAGITYRLDQRGWNAVGSGQANTLRAIAGTTPANAVAVGDGGTVVRFDGGWRNVPSGTGVTLRDVIVEPGLWIVGDNGTLLTGSFTGLRRIELGTSCDLVSVFAKGDEVWVVGRARAGGGAVWRLRTSGTIVRKWGGC